MQLGRGAHMSWVADRLPRFCVGSRRHEAIAVGACVARQGRLEDLDHILPQLRADDYERHVGAVKQRRDRFAGVTGRHPAERRRDSRLTARVLRRR